MTENLFNSLVILLLNTPEFSTVKFSIPTASQRRAQTKKLAFKKMELAPHTTQAQRLIKFTMTRFRCGCPFI